MQPTGEIIAHPARGTLTGNRGVLGFDAQGRLGTARWRHPHWISCTLTHPKGRYHGPQPEGRWTPLFFLDEAVALAAGHRPCGYCRPAAYAAFKSAWAAAHGHALHREMDQALHRSRVTRNRMQITHQAEADLLPDGCFITHEGKPHLLMGEGCRPYLFDRYGAAVDRPKGLVTTLTPKPILAVLAAGFAPLLHNSAEPPLARP